jgi:hypothetical protein
MRSVAEYLHKAVEFDAMAGATTNSSLKKRYVEIAECYRLLAEERKRLVAQGVIASDAPPNSN